MQRSQNKTQRRRGPTTLGDGASAPFESDKIVSSTEESLDALFTAEADKTFHQAWQRLDRGSRLDRLRKFIHAYADVSPAEKASLLAAVLEAFELKQLGTKVAVEYDPVTAQIKSIPGIRFKTAPSGLKAFRYDTTPLVSTEPRQRSTLKTTGTKCVKGAATALKSRTPVVVETPPPT